MILRRTRHPASTPTKQSGGELDTAVGLAIAWNAGSASDMHAWTRLASQALKKDSTGTLGGLCELVDDLAKEVVEGLGPDWTVERLLRQLSGKATT